MMSRIEICFAKTSDEPMILAFLNTHWRANHIFVTNPELLRWQHESPDAPESELTFVFARRIGTEDQSEILALLGFIPMRRFDNRAKSADIALAIWKVRDDVGMPGLGLQLLKTIQRQFMPSLIFAIGTSQVVRPIYAALGYTVGSLAHVALFQETAQNGYAVADGVPAVARQAIAEDPSVELKPFGGETLPTGISASDIDALSYESIPRKSWMYIVNRYVRHPYYDYKIFSIAVDGEMQAIVIWRQIEAAGRNVIRIVDVIGNADILGRCGAVLRKHLVAADAEYVDLMHWGVSAEALASAGFVNPENHQGMVLPCHFEPFERCNTRIEMAFRIASDLSARKLRLFRADSDQDRPNHPQYLKGNAKQR